MATTIPSYPSGQKEVFKRKFERVAGGEERIDTLVQDIARINTEAADTLRNTANTLQKIIDELKKEMPEHYRDMSDSLTSKIHDALLAYQKLEKEIGALVHPDAAKVPVKEKENQRVDIQGKMLTVGSSFSVILSGNTRPTKYSVMRIENGSLICKNMSGGKNFGKKVTLSIDRLRGLEITMGNVDEKSDSKDAWKTISWEDLAYGKGAPSAQYKIDRDGKVFKYFVFTGSDGKKYARGRVYGESTDNIIGLEDFGDAFLDIQKERFIPMLKGKQGTTIWYTPNNGGPSYPVKFVDVFFQKGKKEAEILIDKSTDDADFPPDIQPGTTVMFSPSHFSFEEPSSKKEKKETPNTAEKRETVDTAETSVAPIAEKKEIASVYPFGDLTFQNGTRYRYVTAKRFNEGNPADEDVSEYEVHRKKSTGDTIVLVKVAGEQGTQYLTLSPREDGTVNTEEHSMYGRLAALNSELKGGVSHEEHVEAENTEPENTEPENTEPENTESESAAAVEESKEETTVESLEGESAKNAVYAFLKEDAHHEVIDRDGRIGLVLTWQHKGTTYRGTPYDKGRPLGTEIPKELYEQGITQKHGVDGFFPLVKTFYVETLRTLFQEKKDARPPIPEAERYQASLDWCQKHLSGKSHVVFVRGEVAIKVISDDTVQFFVDGDNQEPIVVPVELSGVSDSEFLDAFNEWVDSVGQAYVDRYEEAAHVVNAFVGKEKIDFQAVKAVFGDDGVARTYLQDFAHNGLITLLPHSDGQPSEWKIDTVIDDDELATAYGSTSEKDIVDSLSDKEKDALAYIERQEFSLSSIECRFLDDGDVDVHLFFDNYTDLPDEQKALFDEEQYESVIEMFEQRLVDAYMDSKEKVWEALADEIGKRELSQRDIVDVLYEIMDKDDSHIQVPIILVQGYVRDPSSPFEQVKQHGVLVDLWRVKGRSDSADSVDTEDSTVDAEGEARLNMVDEAISVANARVNDVFDKEGVSLSVDQHLVLLKFLEALAPSVAVGFSKIREGETATPEAIAKVLKHVFDVGIDFTADDNELPLDVISAYRTFVASLSDEDKVLFEALQKKDATTPAAATPAAATPAAATPATATPATVTPAAATLATVTPAAATPATVTPAAATPAAATPATTTSAAELSASPEDTTTEPPRIPRDRQNEHVLKERMEKARIKYAEIHDKYERESSSFSQGKGFLRGVTGFLGAAAGLGYQDWEKINKNLDKVEKAKKEYETAMAEWRGASLSRALDEGLSLARAYSSAKYETSPWYSKAFTIITKGANWMGNQNLETLWNKHAEGPIENPILRTLAKYGSLRTATAGALLLGGGALTAGGAVPAGIASMALGRVLRGAGTSVAVYEGLKKPYQTTLEQGLTDTQIDKMSDEDLYEQIGSIFHLTAMDGREISQTSYADLYDKLVKALEKRFGEGSDDDIKKKLDGMHLEVEQQYDELEREIAQAESAIKATAALAGVAVGSGLVGAAFEYLSGEDVAEAVAAKTDVASQTAEPSAAELKMQALRAKETIMIDSYLPRLDDQLIDTWTKKLETIHPFSVNGGADAILAETKADIAHLKDQSVDVREYFLYDEQRLLLEDNYDRVGDYLVQGNGSHALKFVPTGASESEPVFFADQFRGTFDVRGGKIYEVINGSEREVAIKLTEDSGSTGVFTIEPVSGGSSEIELAFGNEVLNNTWIPNAERTYHFVNDGGSAIYNKTMDTLVDWSKTGIDAGDSGYDPAKHFLHAEERLFLEDNYTPLHDYMVQANGSHAVKFVPIGGSQDSPFFFADQFRGTFEVRDGKLFEHIGDEVKEVTIRKTTADGGTSYVIEAVEDVPRS